MADLTAKLVFYRIKETILKIKELLTNHQQLLNVENESTPSNSSNYLLARFDLLDLLLVFWILLAILVILLVCIVFKYFRGEKGKDSGNKVDHSHQKDGDKRNDKDSQKYYKKKEEGQGEIFEASGGEISGDIIDGYVMIPPSEWLINFKNWFEENKKNSLTFIRHLKSHILSGLNHKARMSKENVQITFEDILYNCDKGISSKVKINHLTSEPSSTNGIKMIDDIDVTNVHMRVFATERLDSNTKMALYNILCRKLHGQLKIILYPIRRIYHATVTFDTPPDLDLEIIEYDDDSITKNKETKSKSILKNKDNKIYNNKLNIETLDRVVRESISAFQMTIDLSHFYHGVTNNVKPFPLPIIKNGLPKNISKILWLTENNHILLESDLDEERNENEIKEYGIEKYNNIDKNIVIPSYYVPRDDGTFASSHEFYPQKPPRPFVPEFDGKISNNLNSNKNLIKATSGKGNNLQNFNESPYAISLQDKRFLNLPKQLFVKIVKANGLGDILGCQDPYCSVSLLGAPYNEFQTDDNRENIQKYKPNLTSSQKYMTSVIKNTCNPFWDENFLFELWPDNKDTNNKVTKDDKSSEKEVIWPKLKMEVFDRSKNVGEDFLGQAMVPVISLLCNPNQRQIIPLLSRSDRTDPVSGAITVEFLLLDSNGNPLNESKMHSPSIPITSTKRYSETKLMNLTHSRLPIDSKSPHDMSISDKNPSQIIIPNKYTCLHITGIIKNLRDGRIYEVEDIDGKIMPSNNFKEIFIPDSASMLSSLRRSLSLNRKRKRSISKQRLNELSLSRLSPATERSRSAEPSNDKSTLSNKNQNQAQISFTKMDNDRNQRTMSAPPSSPSNKRSISITSPGTDRGGYLEVPVIGSDGSSLHSRYSSATFLVDNSITVLEATHGNFTKYLILPDAYMVNSKCLKFKGNKLHIYNDHAFVAQRIARDETCDVCHKSIGRHFGKGGYVCRDCGVVVHKGCHDRIDQRCPSAKITSVEMIYVMPTET
ncbi:uncharacterized protein LOC135927930 isoform X3 [Gordionus sp. m RMFG-2023]|uniref:uncharacterized protein LOC135927930 isoform X3 n=1 Tax=Gordionus sp. m RMFG-2023 TaxID=3053472 RepID=UPI0031FDF610